MLALSWIFGATLLLTLLVNTMTLPTTDVQSDYLRSNILTEGQPPPPCVNNICPDGAVGEVLAVVPVTIPEIKTGHITGSAHDTNASGHHNTSSHDDPDVPASCLSDDAESNSPPVHSAKVERLRAAYRTAGQPPPPCHNDICPMAHTHRSETVEDSNADTHLAQPEHFRVTFVVTGDHPSIPASCRSGKVRCLFSTNSTDLLDRAHENSTEDELSSSTKKHSTSACRANRMGSHLPTTHQTAPITCGNGTKPPCGKYSKDPNHPSNQSPNATVQFPGTHQTAPITCDDGTKPPCRKYYLMKDLKHSFTNSNGTGHFPGTHQTAPITCGDGKRPPCGTNHSIEDPKYLSNHSSNGTAHHFRGSHQTAPITCGDGTKPPCGKNPHAFNHPSDGAALHSTH